MVLASPATGQNELEAQQGKPPDRIDLTVRSDEVEGPLEDCSYEQEAAAISGEIVVCRRTRDQSDLRYSSDDAAERRYAEATMDKGSPRAPAFSPPCDPKTVGCFRIGRVPPPAYIVDFDALPDTPPGSDADRIARGLAPLGGETAAQPPAPAGQDELGLPPVETPISPSESASPAAQPSG